MDVQHTNFIVELNERLLFWASLIWVVSLFHFSSYWCSAGVRQGWHFPIVYRVIQISEKIVLHQLYHELFSEWQASLEENVLSLWILLYGMVHKPVHTLLLSWKLRRMSFFVWLAPACSFIVVTIWTQGTMAGCRSGYIYKVGRHNVMMYSCTKRYAVAQILCTLYTVLKWLTIM